MVHGVNFIKSKNGMTIDRFIEAQKTSHRQVLSELKRGLKVSHWMWFTFPQIRGLGFSPTSQYFEIQSIDELREFVGNKYLVKNLKACINVLLKLKTNDPVEIFGDIDAMKLQSSMTLFARTSELGALSKQILNKYFNGEFDGCTLGILQIMESKNH